MADTLRSRKLFDDGWLFEHSDDPAYAEKGFADGAWRSVRLPHDWSVDYEVKEDNPTGGGGGYAESGVSWYRKHFTYKKGDAKASFLFDGVFADCDVYVNGVRAGGNGYGYSSFSVPGDALADGENVIAVRVDNSEQPNSRWYTGSGIYRDVWLDEYAPVHMALWGVFAFTNRLYPETGGAHLQIRARIVNETDEPVSTGVVHRLYDAQGNLVSQSGTALRLPARSDGETMTSPVVQNAHLWTDKDPYLYKLVSTVVKGPDDVDEVTTVVGIRTATFDCDRGFLLNGETVKIKGMCVHHDCGVTGAVGYRDSWERRLRALKDMGCNGIRCAHNPPTPALLDLCDELGFLVMDEAFDEWLLTKDKNNNYYSERFAYGSAKYFDREAESIMCMMLHRDRNHPSVILWSIGNEIPEQASADGAKIARFLQDICHREDPTRMVTSACDNIVAAAPSTTRREFEEVLDVVGYNYVGRWRERAETFYDEDRHDYPKRRVVGTENGSAGGTRGVYGKPGEMWRDYRTATMRNEFLFRYMAGRDFVSGDYLWTGIDYLGETRWPSRGAGSGPIDSAGFPKDTYYYFRSIWNEDATTLHVLPHWNWEGDEGEFKTVIVYTNCEEVDLFINGRLVATRGTKVPFYGARTAWYDRGPGRPTTLDLHLTFDVPYEKGELKAVGYRYEDEPVPAGMDPFAARMRPKKRVKIAEETVVTTGAPVALKAQAFKDRVGVDGLAQVEIRAVDANGNFVPTASNKVRCTVTGCAEFKGLDSGDMTDHTLYGSCERAMFSGCLLAVAVPTGKGEFTLSFGSEGLRGASVTLRAE